MEAFNVTILDNSSLFVTCVRNVLSISNFKVFNICYAYVVMAWAYLTITACIKQLFQILTMLTVLTRIDLQKDAVNEVSNTSVCVLHKAICTQNNTRNVKATCDML